MKGLRYALLLAGLVVCWWAFAGKPEAVGLKGQGKNAGPGLITVKNKDWNETSVRKVLQAFAYGGLASDEQITAWAAMKPKVAVAEILTFEPTNVKLSSATDSVASACHRLADFQDFVSSDAPANPKRFDGRKYYTLLSANQSLSSANLQRSWVQIINTRGCNPFLHRVAFYLTNYHAAISMHKVRAGLMADYYDIVLENLIRGGSMGDVLREAASSAAVARAYGHQYNIYKNRDGIFQGNDDFAREYFQLFFRINGDTENTADPDYHELVSIEHNAWLLTGMNLDRDPTFFGSLNAGDWYVPIIDFTDHRNTYIDPNSGEEITRNIRNAAYHYRSDLDLDSCLEILHTDICGETAGAKLAQLSDVSINHPESLDNIPVTIVDFFADDNLADDDKAALRAAWASGGADLLSFLRAYASSTLFHRSNRFKYATAFDRNLFIHNALVLSNEEAFARKQYESPRARMAEQGAAVFQPAHDVFGGQTGLQAANNRYVFKNAYRANATAPWFLYRFELTYPIDNNPANNKTWEKDWRSVIPSNDRGEFVVADVADWLWQRVVADGGKNFDLLARAQVQSLLAHGVDFGYAVDSAQPELAYQSADLDAGPARTLFDEQAKRLIDLESNAGKYRIGMAINFIAMTPFTFAAEGQ